MDIPTQKPPTSTPSTSTSSAPATPVQSAPQQTPAEPSPTPDFSVEIVEVHVPILRYPRWMQISYPEDIAESDLIAKLSSYLDTTTELAQTTETKQLKIMTDPTWSQLSGLGFEKSVYYIITDPTTAQSLPASPYTIEESKDPSAIRNLVEAHFIYHGAYNPNYFTTDIQKRIDDFIGHATQEIEEENAFLLVTKENETPVGFLYAEFEDSTGCVDEMFVVEGRRNNGIGTTMLQKSADYFKNAGCNTIGAYVGCEQEALKFYESRGFQKKSANWIKNLE